MNEIHHLVMILIYCARIGSDTAPFGGVKQSGVGRESGRFGLEECQELKYIALDIAG